MRIFFAWTLSCLVLATASAGNCTEVSCGQDDDVVPELYRLEKGKFSAERSRKYDLKYSGVAVDVVRFPSPIVTPYECNNTVYCEFYHPKKEGKFPAVIVFDVMDGGGVVSRGEAMWLAMHDVSALVVMLPYYGPRQPKKEFVRLISRDVDKTLGNFRQGILDARRAVAWLGEQPEVDNRRIGVVGTSLGSFMGSLLCAVEPKVTTACLLLGGGGIDDTLVFHVVSVGLAPLGVSQKTLLEKLSPIDSLNYCDRLKGKKLLLLAASRDNVVYPSAVKRFWEATGKPPITWYDCDHIGAAAYAFPMMKSVVEHFQAN